MKKNNIMLIIIGVLVIGIIILFVLFLSVNSKLKNNSTIYCVMEDEKNESKMEFYFDYRDGKIYRYSIVNTNKMTENINVDSYINMIEKNNNQYKGALGKFWTDNNVYITTEVYDLDLLSEKEFQELTSMSKKELREKTRQEIIDSFIPMTNGGTFQCN